MKFNIENLAISCKLKFFEMSSNVCFCLFEIQTLKLSKEESAENDRRVNEKAGGESEEAERVGENGRPN